MSNDSTYTHEKHLDIEIAIILSSRFPSKNKLSLMAMFLLKISRKKKHLIFTNSPLPQYSHAVLDAPDGEIYH